MNAVAARLSSFELSYGNAEWLKLFGFICMVLDHSHKALDVGGPAFVFAGRLAMPIFAFLIARHLVAGSQSIDRLFGRLLLVGVVSSWPYVVLLQGGDVFPLNILFTFLVGLVVVRSVIRDRFWLAVLVFVVGSAFVDYQWAGVGLVVASWAWWERRDALSVVWVSVALVALCIFNGNWFAFAAVPVVAFVAWADLILPRVRHFFWIGYPAHLLLLVVLAFGV